MKPLLLFVAAAILAGQAGFAAEQQNPAVQASPAGALSTESLRPNYVLGPGDQIMVRAFEMEDMGERPVMVDGDGNINLPILGVIQTSGLTVAQLETRLIAMLRKYVKEPRVTVSIVQFRSEPVFFVGAFQKPGIYPLQGKRTLVEMLSAIGGLQPSASRFIKVSRRKEVGIIPLPNAITTPDGKGSSVRISLGSLRDNVNPAEDLVLEPYDVVSAEKAELIYVNGAIGRIGGIDLTEKESMSVTQLVTLAGGLGKDADGSKARLLRPVLNTSRRAEIDLNITRIMDGRDPDFPIMPNDMLYIPTRGGLRGKLGKSALVLIPFALGISILLATRL